MKKTFILCEKPSVAADFQAALGGIKKDGYFESESHVITFCIGHLLNLNEPEDYNPSWKEWKIDELPLIPEFKYKPVQTTSKQLNTVVKLLNEHKGSKIIIATDAGREGELIARLVLNHAGVTSNQNIFRFWSSEALIKEVIIKGLQNVKPITEYDYIYMQGLVRQQSDWLIGINFTRLLTIKFNSLFSFGRVQTALLNLIYKRHIEIKNFSKVKYYRLIANLQKDEIDFNAFLEIDGKSSFDQEASLSKVYNGVKDQNTGFISQLEKIEKIVHPPLLFNLTGLQKAANKQFGYKAKKTAEIAQTLYENYKCLSYPRTPSQYLPCSAFENVKRMIDLFMNSCWAEEYPNFNWDKVNVENKRVFNDKKIEDHYALMPLAFLPAECSKEEYNIYCLVIKSFLNAFSDDYIYEAINFTLKVGSHDFKGKGKRIISSGWKPCSEPDQEDVPAEENDLPVLTEGETINIRKLEVKDYLTQPPKYFTEASLLAAMENPGKECFPLGTPATRAGIIETLFDRQYILQQKKSIMCLEKGIFLIENLKVKQLIDFICIETTARWEASLDDNPNDFLNSIKDFTQVVVSLLKSESFNSFSIKAGICPVCGADINEGKNNFYCTSSTKKNPCFSISKQILGATINLKLLQVLLSGHPTSKLKFKKDANSFEASLQLENNKLKFVY